MTMQEISTEKTDVDCSLFQIRKLIGKEQSTIWREYKISPRFPCLNNSLQFPSYKTGIEWYYIIPNYSASA